MNNSAGVPQVSVSRFPFSPPWLSAFLVFLALPQAEMTASAASSVSNQQNRAEKQVCMQGGGRELYTSCIKLPHTGCVFWLLLPAVACKAPHPGAELLPALLSAHPNPFPRHHCVCLMMLTAAVVVFGPTESISACRRALTRAILNPTSPSLKRRYL